MKIWVAVSPDGTICLPIDGEGKAGAIRRAREQATLDYEIAERCDLVFELSWAEARSAGYCVRKATLAVPA